MDRDLLKKLKEWRRDVAQKEGADLFRVLSNSAIEAIVTLKPSTKEELLSIKGIKEKKFAKYGDEILQCVARYSNNQKPDSILGEDRGGALTVGVFLDRINELLNQQRAFVVGEVSSFKLSERWLSFSLKDQQEDAVLRCYLPRWSYQKIGVQVADGMVVKIGGYPRVTKRSGDIGFVAESIEPVGEGSLKQAYELLKKKLQAEGLFDQKRVLPEFVQSVALVTSRDGVVIKDFMHNMRKIGARVYFYDTRVEGKDAIPGIIEAIEWFNAQKLGIDVLVIMRGGGSLESLQAFDNELVARAIFASKIPTMAAVGHHVDAPIANLVADKEVSTPSVAAHEINRTWDRLFVWLPRYAQDISRSVSDHLRMAEGRIRDLGWAIFGAYADDLVTFKKMLSTNQEKLVSGFRRHLISTRQSLLTKERYFRAVDPRRNLHLGYSLIFHNGKVVKSVKSIKVEDSVKTKLYDGEFTSKVETIS